jgi:hypothetical protein
MKFEYKMLSISTAHLKKETFQTDLITKFNELGKQGWDLVNAEGLTNYSYFSRPGEITELLFVFKRVIS